LMSDKEFAYLMIIIILLFIGAAGILYFAGGIW